MAQLIHIRQRLKTVATIRETMHAMRLIAMSMHSRFKSLLAASRTYNEALQNLINSISAPSATRSDTRALIIITPFKGFCGTYGEELLAYVKKEEPGSHYMITLGEEAAKFTEKSQHTSVLHIKNVGINALEKTMDAIWQTISALSVDAITIYALKSHSFFAQKPSRTTVFLPNNQITPAKSDLILLEPEAMGTSLRKEQVRATIYQLLIEACIAEQAARFVSMHNATQNADRITNDLHSAYNKTRQTKVTSELADLTGNMLDNE